MQTSNDFMMLLRYIYRKKVFVFYLLTFFIASYLINNYIFNSIPFKLDSSVKTLMLGNSQIMYGLDPSVIKNSINTAQADEPKVVSYYKLKYLVSNNKNIKNVIVPFSPIQFTHTYDNIFTDKVYASEMLRRAIYLLSYNNMLLFNVSSFDYFESFIRNRLVLSTDLVHNYIVNNFDRKDLLWLPFIGEFIDKGDDKLDDNIDVDKLIEDRFEGYNEARGLVDAQFIDSITNYCVNNKLNLYLVGMPVIKGFYRKVPVGVNSYMDKKLETLLSYDNVEYFPLFTCFDDSLFADWVHLNGEGAKLCSKIVYEKMKK